jgi:uncharacterized protein GlcG (DUF336 family)
MLVAPGLLFLSPGPCPTRYLWKDLAERTFFLAVSSFGAPRVAKEKVMNPAYGSVIAATSLFFGGLTCSAETLKTHRIPAALAAEAVSEAVSQCARQGYQETAVMLDADGATIAALRGDGAGIHTLDSAHDKAYTSASFKRDTIALAEVSGISALSKLPHIIFFGGGVVVKTGDEVIGAIGASGAPGAKLDDNCARAGLDKIRDRLK